MHERTAKTRSNRLNDRPGAPGIALGSWAFSFGPFEAAPWSFEEFCNYTALHGYDAVEINGFLPHPDDREYSTLAASALGDDLRSRGLQIAGYAPDLRTTPPGEVPIADYLARIASIAEFCRACRIDLVRVDTITPWTGPRGTAPDAARDRLGETWRRSAQLLGDHGIRLVWEFEPGFWLNRPSQVLDLCERVDHPNFGVLFDTSHAHTLAAYGAHQGPDPELLDGGAAGFARLVAPFVQHLHLIDSDGSLHDDDTSSHLPFGEGEVDFDGVLDALGERAAALPWWTLDFCFWPETVRDAAAAVPVVTDLRDRFLHRLSAKENVS